MIVLSEVFMGQVSRDCEIARWENLRNCHLSLFVIVRIIVIVIVILFLFLFRVSCHQGIYLKCRGKIVNLVFSADVFLSQGSP